MEFVDGLVLADSEAGRELPEPARASRARHLVEVLGHATQTLEKAVELAARLKH